MPAREEVPMGKTDLRETPRMNILTVSVVNEVDVTGMALLHRLLHGNGA